MELFVVKTDTFWRESVAILGTNLMEVVVNGSGNRAERKYSRAVRFCFWSSKNASVGISEVSNRMEEKEG